MSADWNKDNTIGKEWDEQVAAFENYCIGKTAEEITGIAVNPDTGYVDGLATSCTMHPGNFQYVVAEAIKNATVTGAKSTDKLGLGVATKLNDSKDATAEKNGVAEVAVTVSATTVDATGKVTSILIDAVQASVEFDQKGAITNDISADVLTKKEKGDAYGMAADWNTANKIGKEWDEQVVAFENYCLGKNAEQITGISVNPETGYVDELATSCTMHPGNFQYVVAEAVNNAK